MINISVGKILKLLFILLPIIFLIITFFASIGNVKPYLKKNFQEIWNDYYIKGNIEGLNFLYKNIQDNVSKNKIQKCPNEGFYSEPDNNNIYFCKDNTIFIFAGESFYKTLLLTLEKSWIGLLIASLFISILLVLNIYIRFPISFYKLKNKSLTLNDVEKKFQEVVELYMEYIKDIKNFDNNPTNNTNALFKYALIYYLVSKRHNNEILNKLNEITRLIYNLGLQDSFYYFFVKKREFIINIIKGSKTLWLYETFFMPLGNNIFNILILTFILIYIYSYLTISTLNIFSGKFIFINYYLIEEGIKSLVSFDFNQNGLFVIILGKFIIIYLISLFFIILLKQKE